METLQVELQDVGGTSWWARLLAAISSPKGSSLLRFVGRVGSEIRYSSDTITTPTPVSPSAPEAAWTHVMSHTVQHLIRQIEQDGWVQTGAGSNPWSLTFERPEPES